jgi:acyl carrier protein
MNAQDRIREVLDLHGKLKRPAVAVDADADLFAAGMTSHASVNVMLALEDAFDVEFPDALLTKNTFCTIRSMELAMASLRSEAA